MNSMANFILLLVSVVFGATGQFLFKIGMQSYGQVSAMDAFKNLLSIIITPQVFSGFVLFGLSSVLWLSVISKSQLSYAYPMVSMGYVLTLIMSKVFLNEQVGFHRILGTILIISGVLFISKS